MYINAIGAIIAIGISIAYIYNPYTVTVFSKNLIKIFGSSYLFSIQTKIR